MSITQKTAIDKFYREEGNDEIHPNDAAGLVASYVHARHRALLSQGLRRYLIEPVPLMLQNEKSPAVWAKVINTWLKDSETHRGSGFDRLLDPCVFGVIQNLVEPKGGEWTVQGDSEAQSDYQSALCGFRREIDRREKDRRIIHA